MNGDFGTFNSPVLQPIQLGYQTNYNQINYNAGNSTPRQYAITNDSKTVNTANFKSLFDHTTGDGTGNMMVVDGDSNEIFGNKIQINNYKPVKHIPFLFTI